MSQVNKEVSQGDKSTFPEEAQDRLNSLYLKGRQRVSQIRERQYEKFPPEILYHYTSDEGFHGIVSSGSIWATDLFSLNDPSELRHGLSPVVEALEAKAIGGLAQAKTIAEIFKRVQATGVSQVGCYQVACLSLRGDDLGQWRSYGQGGKGYAVGFEAGELVASFGGEGESMIDGRTAFPIIYDDQLLAETQQALVDDAFELIELPKSLGFNDGLADKFYRRLGAALTYASIEIASTFKHRAYENEQEYRMMAEFPAQRPSPECKWLRRPHELVRYIECDWRSKFPNALREVVIGPAGEAAKLERFVENCLKAYGAGDVLIRRSAIPFR